VYTNQPMPIAEAKASNPPKARVVVLAREAIFRPHQVCRSSLTPGWESPSAGPH
jgi:hypothetical protein